MIYAGNAIYIFNVYESKSFPVFLAIFVDQNHRIHVKIISFISYTGLSLPLPLIVRMTINIVKLINAYDTLHRTQLYMQSLSKICDIREWRQI